MIYLVLFLFVYGPSLLSENISTASDTVRVFEKEAYLELPLQIADIRNFSTAFNPVNDHIYVFDLNSNGVLWEFKPDGSVSPLDTLAFPDITTMMPIDITHSGESIWFWELGLGKVFEYTFSDSSLKKIDKTRVQDLMVGHGSVITKDERILAQGGYGFWEFRNFLLEFNQGSGEWNKIKVFGDIPVTPTTHNYLGYAKQENLLIYIFVPLSAVEQGSGDLDVRTFEPFFEVYTLNLESNQWTYRNSIYPKDTDLGFLKRPRSRATHSLDYSRDTLVFNGSFAINIQTFEVSNISHPSIDDLWSTNFYYSKNSDRWIVIGRDYGVSKHHLVVRSFPASEAQLTPVDEELSATIVWLGWFLGGFTVLAVVVFGVQKWKNRSDEEETQTSENIMITEKNGVLTVSVGGENMDLSDTIFKQFFKVVADMKKQGKSEILMSEFDQLIFSDQHSQPFRSKMKKKIFKLVNNKANTPIITIDVYPIDKRYKMIVMDLPAVSINRPKNGSMKSGVETSV